MKKIPTLFKRENEGKRLVCDEVNEPCQWVIDGEGVPTLKYDGTCCLIENGKFFKRRELKKDDKIPPHFRQEDSDPVTGKKTGWVPVTDSPENKYHLEAFSLLKEKKDGSYELVGPKIQGNPHHFPFHCLIEHGVYEVPDFPRTFEFIKEYMRYFPWEGIVWHHPDGRKVKIKRKDFFK